MVKDVLEEMELLKDALVIQPKDVSGQDKNNVINRVFGAAKKI